MPIPGSGEGGGPNPPYGEDFFDRIVGVHWPRRGAGLGSGTFVAGDGRGNIYCLKVGVGATRNDLLQLAWVSVGNFVDDSGSGFGVTFTGSSYGLVGGKEPVFVMVGYGGGTNGQGQIYASQDGMNWSNVFTLVRDEPDRNTGAEMFGVVWDTNEKAFYADANQSWDRTSDSTGEGGDPNLHEFDILLRSDDGVSWSEAGRVDNIWLTAGGPPPVVNYPTGLLEAHCSKMVVDAKGNGVPDGIYKYDPTNKILIRPDNVPKIDYLFGYVDYGTPGGLSMVNMGAGITPPVTSPGFPVISVAGTGGYWVAAGGTIEGAHGTCEAAIQVPSTDPGGIRWRTLNPPGSEAINTMVGGQAKAPPP